MLRSEGPLKSVVSFLLGSIMILVFILVVTQVSTGLGTWAISVVEGIITRIEFGTEFMDTLQTVVSTALATFLGAWFAFRWQHHKESEEHDKSFFRQVDLLIFYAGSQIKYLKVMREVFSQRNGDYRVPSFHFNVSKPKEWDISNFDLLICEAGIPLMDLCVTQDLLPTIYTRIDSMREFIVSGDRIKKLVACACAEDLWLWVGTEAELVAALGSDCAEEYLFANESLVNEIDRLIHKLDTELVCAIELLTENIRTTKSVNWLKSRKLELI